jgi:uncharacterized repeat protein (TIGR01451 family)
VIVTPTQVGQITNTASVGSKEMDVDPNDNTRQETTNVDAGVDLELTKVDSPDPVTVGENLTYKLSVFNNSDNDATEVNLTETLPQGVTLVSSSITPANNSNNILTFDLGTLAAKETKTVDVIVTPIQVGQITNTASVGSKEIDVDPNDNTRQETTEVKTNSFYKFSSWKYETDGNGIQIVADKTIYAEFPTGVIPNLNGMYKGGYILDSLTPLSRSQVPNPSEIINEDISNQFLNTNEILQAAKITQVIYNSNKTIGALFDLTGLELIGDISQASLAKLRGYNHFNWLQTVGTQISPDVDWYSGTRQDFENGNSKLVSNSGTILTNSGLFVDSLSGGNFIIIDFTSLGVTFNSYVSELGNLGWSINAVNLKSIDAISPTGKKYKVIDDPNGVYQIQDTNQGRLSDTKGFYIDIPGQGGNDTEYTDLLSSNGSILGFEDSPDLATFDPKKGTQFTTYLVGVKSDLDFKTSQILPISNSNFKWYSTVMGDSGTITGASLDIQADPSILTGGIEISNNNLTLNELSQEEKQFLEENGVDVTPPNVNLSVVRTNNSETIDIGQDYTYSLKVTNNGSDPATQIVLT